MFWQLSLLRPVSLMYHLVNMDHPYYDNPPNFQQHCELMTININSLISEVEARSVLWDRNNLYYTDRFVKRAAWQEVYKALNPNFDQFPKLQQLLIGNAIERRWRSLRESFSKRVRCERQSNQGEKKTPYVYNHQLDFLRKVIVPNSTSPSSDEDCVVDSQSSSKVSTLEEKLVHFLEAQSQREQDYHQNFFDSLLPIVRKLDDHQALSFRSQVLRLLQEFPSSSANSADQEGRSEESPDNSMGDYTENYQHQHPEPGQSFERPLSDQSTFVSQGPSSSCDSGIENPVCASSLIQSAVCVALNMQTSNL